MVLDQPGQPSTIPRLGARLLCYALITWGLVESLCVLVAVMSTGLEWAPLFMVLGGLAIGTTVSGAGLSYGSSHAMTGLKILVGLAVVGALISAAVPHYAYGVSVPIALFGLPLFAAMRYLERSGFGSTLRPKRTEDNGRFRTFVRRMASALRRIGGLGLVLWGLAVGAVVAVGCLQALMGEDRWKEVTVVVAVTVTAWYLAPCLALGFVIWREPPSPLVTLMGFGLAVVTAGAMNDVWFLALIPESIASVLAIGLLAPAGRPAPYAAPGVK